MRKTLNRETEYRLAVSADTLAAMLDCGRPTAVKIGEESGARVRIGRRTLYKVSAVESYLDRIAAV